MTNVLATANFNNARLSQNPVVINIDAVSEATYPDRAKLRYYCQLMVPESYLSPKFVPLIRLEGAEEPPVAAGPGKLYPGAFFEIQNQLDPLLERTPPEFDQRRISVANMLTMPYYCILTVEYDDDEVFKQTLPVEYLVKAGVDETDYYAYKDQFFTDYIGSERRFLTWQPDRKTLQPDQPEFLYFLTNFNPSPTTLKVGYTATFSDHSEESGTTLDLQNVFPQTVYCIPVGPEALGFDSHEKELLSYTVWLENENSERVSEIRTYLMDQNFQRNVRFVVFANSLGGFDTLALVGQGEESLTVRRSISERFGGWEFRPEYAEQVINATTGTRQLKVATGWLTKDALRYLEELILSKEVYLETDRAFVPLIPRIESFSSFVDDENLIGRSLVFEYTNDQSNFSALPNPLDLQKRPTGWRPKASACLLDAFGKRTGYRQATILEKYYLDDNSRVVGARMKANVPGTEGYIPPVSSVDCQDPAFLSAQISRSGTFNKRGCASPLTGGPATITIPAGMFGSEVSQADANSKAESEYRRTNTQTFADLNGVCLLEPERYAYNVPNGFWHYRAADPKTIALYWQIPGDEKQSIGNAWIVQGGSSPYVFPMNSNDLNYPINYQPGGWRMLVYGSPKTTRLVKIYQDGVLQLTRQITTNQDGFEQVMFTNSGTDSFSLVDRGKIYITNDPV